MRNKRGGGGDAPYKMEVQAKCPGSDALRRNRAQR